MGLLKLAVIGGVAFWAGSRYNEKHEGGCRRQRHVNRHLQSQQQPDSPRDMADQDSSYYHDSPYHSNEKGAVHPTYAYVQDTKQAPPTDAIPDERPPMYGYRRSSLKLTEQQQQERQQQQQQQLEAPRYQQMVFVEPKRPYSVEPPMWK